MAEKYTPKIKEALRDELRVFLQEKKLKINFGIMSNLNFKKLEDGQNNSDYFLDDYLEKGIKQNGERKYWMEFVSQLLRKKETQYLGLRFLIAKEVYSKDYDYQDYNEIFLKLLEPYKESYISYVNRMKWIDANTNKLSEIVKNLDGQKAKEDLIKTALKVKSFDKLKFKTQLYNIIQKEIRNKKQFEGLFPELENKNEDVNQFISKINKEEVIFVDLNIQQINQYYCQYEIGSYRIAKIISDFSSYANKDIENLKNELNVRTIEVNEDKNGKFLEIKYYGNNLNEEKLNLFSICIIQGMIERKFNPLEGDKDLRENELIKQIIKQALVKTNKIYLQNNLKENTEQIARPKL